MRRPGDAENALRLLLHQLRLLRVPQDAAGKWAWWHCSITLGRTRCHASGGSDSDKRVSRQLTCSVFSSWPAAEKELLLAAGKAHLELMEQGRRLYLKARALSLAQVG